MTKNSSIIIEKGKKYKYDEIIHFLLKSGYERNPGILSPGQFSFLGGNLNIFLINSADPVRVEFFGDEVDRISFFSKESNLYLSKIDSLKILPNVLKLDNGSKIYPGDYVVHDDHGVGLFANFEVKKIADEEITYIVLKYLNNDVLYVPLPLKEKISQYIGIGRKRPKLNKLGSKTWEKTYKKTYENILLMARELLQIYAEREIVKSDPWSIDKSWEEKVVKTFGYKETIDQVNALKEVYNDLMSDIPMDRLICGDVGFGKTEVALRAAVQACANGYQVAVLVPTTILCEQHYVTFCERLKELPINISHLSRFVDRKKQTEVISQLQTGEIDIIIGTHSLFQDLKYKNLGLLIIDEEQKFGVKDKEKLKQLKSSINILTMTATPIPRTLFMGLSGLRDLSQINTPPDGRKEVETSVKKYDEKEIVEFIKRETSRSGQVYYLHNEVMTIGGTKNKLQKLFPDLRIEVAHGQMSEILLAETMSRFSAGDIDILVCSTIIENGLDLPNANTLIVENADKFGLSQLYQIRGRIGRSQKQSYSLFTYANKEITDNAFKRLKALAENSELGTGYNISMSDLEIRGGGNILGKEQHGNMEAIGLVLYTKMLNKAVEKLKK